MAFLPTRGLPRESRAGSGGRARGREAAALASPSRARSSCRAAQRKRPGRAGQTGMQAVPPPAGALGPGEDGTRGGMMRWPQLAECSPSELSPRCPRSTEPAEGRSSCPSPSPPSEAAPAVPGAAPGLARPWPPLLPPQARVGPYPSPAALRQPPRPPACPVGWSLGLGHGDGGLGAGRLLPERGRAAFYAPAPCKSGLGWALPSRTSCVCCPLITGLCQ